jgi:hypothetical protein
MGSPLGPVGAGIGAGFGGASGFIAGTVRDRVESACCPGKS